MNDIVNHPVHYNSHPSGVECIEITEHMNYNLGNAIKYIWRAGQKGDQIEDLMKARFYLEREINRQNYMDPGRNQSVPVQLELDFAPVKAAQIPSKKADNPQKPAHRTVQCESAKGRLVPKPSRPG